VSPNLKMMVRRKLSQNLNAIERKRRNDRITMGERERVYVMHGIFSIGSVISLHCIILSMDDAGHIGEPIMMVPLLNMDFGVSQ
jgi:hypothetical protein